MQVFAPIADNYYMNIHDTISLVKQVLLNPYVIGTTVIVILYMNFCCFVANYRKKPPKIKKLKKNLKAALASSKTEAKKSENAENTEENSSESAKTSS